MNGPLTRIHSVDVHQFIVLTALHDGPIDHRQNFVCIADGGEPVSHSNGRPLRIGGEQVLLDATFGFCVECTARFVKDEQTWCLQHGASQTDTGTLTA
ncbi:MAG: hypothetical protein CMA08_05080 [Euryarchaeota archaeon]|nr:hypothetical protein [Euryarchaeota archaeon]OUX20813.1 MAG: hypothetical protein CBE12_05025 [Euryarchaeota archaeon TMED252]